MKARATTYAPCTNYYTPGIAIQGGYGAAYDLIGGTGQMEVQANCAKTTPTLDIGKGDQADLIYKIAYLFYQNGAWVSQTLTSPNTLKYTNWYPASASFTIPSSALTSTSYTYAVGYVCSYVPFWAKDIKVGFANINAKAEDRGQTGLPGSIPAAPLHCCECHSFA
jgi:hypothetical protein